MTRPLLLAALLCCGCDGYAADRPFNFDGRDELKSKEACEMKDGEAGCTVDWAFNGHYSVYPRCIPPGTIRSPIQRDGDDFIFDGKRISRSSWGCEQKVEAQSDDKMHYVEWVSSDIADSPDCKKRDVEGTSCVVCGSIGSNVAVSCDWSNASNDAPIEGHAFKFKNKHYDPNTAPLKVWDNAPYSAPSFEENPSLSERR